MDFFKIEEVYKDLKTASVDGKTKLVILSPNFIVRPCRTIMVRGKSFYAIWDEDTGLWSTDPYRVVELVDRELGKRKDELEQDPNNQVVVKWMQNYDSQSWRKYKQYLKDMDDFYVPLDSELTFANSIVRQDQYASRRLPYSLEPGSIDAYEQLVSVLFSPEEREKLEWAVGAVVAGEAKSIQKFIVMYGEAGTGKSTYLNIIEQLFPGYIAFFEAKALGSANNSFAMEDFVGNPLVAIQHDGDLSKIEDNSKLNSIIAHEMMVYNEKYKSKYSAKSIAFLFMGTNRPVKITDSKSGLLRRLIDVRPTGEKVPPNQYYSFMEQIKFELGAIAYHCLGVYKTLGKNRYATYRPMDMMFKTDVFYNFIEYNYFFFKDNDGCTLKQAYSLYKVFCDEMLVDFKLPMYKFREELKDYFSEFHQMTRVEGVQTRSYYEGFLADKFEFTSKEEVSGFKQEASYVTLPSRLDKILVDQPAQYCKEDGTPLQNWSKVKTTLADIDTSNLHYVKLPEEHIVIDFDLRNESGEKDLALNLEAAAKWPKTYGELSKSGAGIHLHYIYSGDVKKLNPSYAEGIEVKVFVGNSALRRLYTKSNDQRIATITSGLPLKGEKMLNNTSVTHENGLRKLVSDNLDKKYHPGTKPSVEFILKILDDAYASRLSYDISDMRPKILQFAANSTNNSAHCIKLVSRMKFKSEEPSPAEQNHETDQLVFYDVEVFPNLFIVCWKIAGKDKQVVKMINPSAKDIFPLLNFKLVGFNNRRYDNHILYAASYGGYSVPELYQLSQRIISGSRNAMFGEAYNLSYTDIYDFASTKQSLKKFEIARGTGHHKESRFKWDEPVPEDCWEEVASYCCNDVVETELTFDELQPDYLARLILAELSGLTPNDTTQQHTAKIIFGDDKNPQEKFNYVDLSVEFSGYVFEEGKSLYKGEDPKEGGYVWAIPGVYGNAALLDIASMHPTSAIIMQIFGPYTKNYEEILQARLAIKHKEYDKARQMFNGRLAPYLVDEKQSKALSYALKIAINIVYGLTSATFPNKFRDPRNIDNIVAKRGSLFMINLKEELKKRGFEPFHIKTDSVKIADATPEIIQFVMDYGKQYGYTFEHEATYDKIALLNDAVYVAKDAETGEWTSTGTQLIHPYIFKGLFSREEVVFRDLWEIKSVTTSFYLDMNESLPEGEHNYIFIGRVGAFCPIKEGCGGGLLMREKEGKYYAANGTKGYRWLSVDMIQELDKVDDIDMTYYEKLANETIKDISQYANFDWFVSDEVYNYGTAQIIPF